MSKCAIGKRFDTHDIPKAHARLRFGGLRHPRGFVYGVLFGFLILLLSLCSRYHSGLVSLFDEIDSHEEAGPWKIIALHTTEKGASISSNSSDNTQRYSSSFRYGIRPRIGSTILIRITYESRLRDGSVVEARLSNEETTLTKVSTPLSQKCALFRFQCPANNIRFLDILHTGVGGRSIPLKSVIAVEVQQRAGKRAIQRVKSLLEWAVDQSEHDATQVLAKKRFGLFRENDMRQSVVLTGEDTLYLSLPKGSRDANLRFWTTSLSRQINEDDSLKTQILRNNQWTDLGAIRDIEQDSVGWIPITQPILGEHEGKLRFIHVGGKRSIVAVGAPIVLPSMGRDTRKKNLILIDLDTMRSDRLGSNGYTHRPTSVQLDSILHKRGFHVFRRAHSPGSWTLPATSKFLTSRYIDIDLHRSRTEDAPTIAEVLHGNGYYCAAITGGGVLRLKGFERGFHEYFCSEQRSRRVGLGKVEDVFPRAFQFLREVDADPFFLFIHTYETHDPYTRDTFCRGLEHGRLGDLMKGEMLLDTGSFDARAALQLTPEESLYIQAAYDGGVKKACDATVGLFRLMDELDLWKNSVVIILSDHGEEFWEHSTRFADHHEATLYGEVLNVPFMIYDPEISTNGIQFRDEDVSTVDLLPTATDLLEIPLISPCDGISLEPLMRGESVVRHTPVLSFTYPTTCSIQKWPSRPCIITDGVKYIPPLEDYEGPCPGALAYSIEEQLYLLNQDPGEIVNEVSRMTTLKEQISQYLCDGIKSAIQPTLSAESEIKDIALHEDLHKQLEILGYIDEGEE